MIWQLSSVVRAMLPWAKDTHKRSRIVFYVSLWAGVYVCWLCVCMEGGGVVSVFVQITR